MPAPPTLLKGAGHSRARTTSSPGAADPAARLTSAGQLTSTSSARPAERGGRPQLAGVVRASAHKHEDTAQLTTLAGPGSLDARSQHDCSRGRRHAVLTCDDAGERCSFPS